MVSRSSKLPQPSRNYRSRSLRSQKETETRFTALIKPKSILCIQRGFDYFNGTRAFPSKTSEVLFYKRLRQANSLLTLYCLDLAKPLPDSPIEKGRLWTATIRPRVPLVKDALKYCEAFIHAGLTEKASFAIVEGWLDSCGTDLESTKNIAHMMRVDSRRILKEIINKRLGANEETDPELIACLSTRVEAALRDRVRGVSCYLYFKVWSFPDGSRWYKIGITSDLQRRDAEQNVLPVPPETLAAIKFLHSEYAKAAEQAFHGEMLKMQIKGARNRELFSLTPCQVVSVIAAMKLIARGPASLGIAS